MRFSGLPCRRQKLRIGAQNIKEEEEMKVAEQKRLEKRREVTRREERLREEKLREE